MTGARGSSFAQLIALALALVAGATGAQTYPAKAVRLVVPFLAGGSTDIVGRTVAQKLSEMWGQQVFVDNRPGGGTTIGTDMVAKAAPDGYTLLVTPAPFTINPSLLAKLPYDALNDFAPITLINTTPLVMVVHPGVPAKNVKELIALAKAKPGKLNFGSSGTGGSNHLAGELFDAMAGVKMVHIPYKGNAGALTDIVGGHLDVVYNGITSAIALIYQPAAQRGAAGSADARRVWTQGFRGRRLERPDRAGKNAARRDPENQRRRHQDCEFS